MPAIFHDVFNRKTIRRGIFFVAIYSYHFVDKIFQKISSEGDIGPVSELRSHWYSLLSLTCDHQTCQPSPEVWAASGGACCLITYLSLLSPLVINWTLGVNRSVGDWGLERWLLLFLLNISGGLGWKNILLSNKWILPINLSIIHIYSLGEDILHWILEYLFWYDMIRRWFCKYSIFQEKFNGHDSS